MKKILFISFRLPWPFGYGGYNLRVLNIAQVLKEKYEVHLLSLQDKKIDTKGIENYFDKIFLIPHSKKEKLIGLLKALFWGLPFQVGYFWSFKLKKWLEKNHKNYEILFFFTLRTAPYVKNLKGFKILDFIDAISLNYSSAKKYVSFPLKILYHIETNRLLKYEKKILKENIFEKFFISSFFDKNLLQKYSQKEIVVLPIFLRQKNFEYLNNSKKENWIIFLGKLDYLPNKDAVLFFSKKIFPYIKKAIPQAEFLIVGFNPPKEIKKLTKDPKIKVLPNQKDHFFYLQKSKVFVAPLRFGAGMQTKILEAMASGLAVVASPPAARGFKNIISAKHLFVCSFQKPKDFAKIVIEVFLSEKIQKKIGKEAKEFVFKNYQKDKIKKIIFENLP